MLARPSIALLLAFVVASQTGAQTGGFTINQIKSVPWMRWTGRPARLEIARRAPPPPCHPSWCRVESGDILPQP
jgi:hypothetical protein